MKYSSQEIRLIEKIQKAINGMAVKMRTHNNKGCFYIEAMNDFISTASN